MAPDPRNTNSGTVTIEFTEPVTGVDVADFGLTRNGTAVSLTDLTVGGSGTTYTLDLSAQTAAAGRYVLTLTAAGAGIQDPAGNALGTDASDTWVMSATVLGRYVFYNQS